MSGIAVVIVLVVVTVGLTFLLLALIRRMFSQEELEFNNQTVGNYLAIISVVYGVFLAFVILVLWEQRDRADEHVETEAAELNFLFHISLEFPDPLRSDLLGAIRTYDNNVINVECPYMVRRELKSLYARNPAIDAIWELLAHSRPSSEAEQALRTQALDVSEKIYIARRMRLLDAGKSLGPYLWMIVIVGGIATIFPTLFTHVRSFAFLVVTKSCTVLVLLLVMYTIHDLQGPFQGSWRVKPDAYILDLERMDAVLQQRAQEAKPGGAVVTTPSIQKQSLQAPR